MPFVLSGCHPTQAIVNAVRFQKSVVKIVQNDSTAVAVLNKTAVETNYRSDKMQQHVN